ncbi:MAG: B12-binding domain-containing protein [Candidatus Freyrarchaeum guaymaensis]
MLKRAVVDFDEKEASEVAAEIVEQGIDVTAGVEALRQGMVRVAEMYENKSPHGSSKSTGRNRPQIQIRHLNGL